MKKSTNLITALELRHLRESLGLSQDAFAKKIGVTRTYYSRIESGEKPIKSTFQKKIDRFQEERAERANPEITGLSIEALLMANGWASRVNQATKMGITPAKFISLCVLTNGDAFCRRMIEEFNSAVDIAAAKTFQVAGQGILPKAGGTAEQSPRDVQLKPKAEQDSGKK